MRNQLARLVNVLGDMPFLGKTARTVARFYREGSVTRIRSGVGAGLAWRRSHRYVNGYWVGAYELETQVALARLLRPGGVVFDIGANAGFFSLLAARLVRENGFVLAVDPISENVNSISEQLRLNGFRNAEVLQSAVGSSSGRTSFSFNPRQTALGHIGEAVAGQTTIEVPLATLDELACSRRPPDLVKIDVEGAEVDVLAGAAETIRRGTTFLIEIHGRDKGQAVADLLAPYPYRFQTLRGDAVSDPSQQAYLLATIS